MVETLKSIITAIFGEYTPVTYQMYDSVNDTYYDVVASGFAGVDWPYVCSVVLFAIVMFCVFRIIGGILKNA